MDSSSRLVFLGIISVLAIAAATQAEDEKTLLCYVIRWSVYRKPHADFSMDKIDPSLCTHLVYAYLGMNDTDYSVESKDLYGESDVGKKGLITQFVDVRKNHPKLKVLFSIGGWSEGSVKFSKMAANRQNRSAFIKSVLEFIKAYKFDGMDLAWVAPGQIIGTAGDKENLVLLLKELREKFDEFGYQLTLQLDAKKDAIDAGYDVEQISKYVDYVNLLSFDYQTPWDLKVGPNAPLDSEDEDNVAFSVNYLIQKGGSPEKMLLGMAAQGHPFALVKQPSASGNYMGAKTSDIIEGKWSAEAGFIAFNEICDDLKNSEGWTEHWHNESSTAYAVRNNVLYSYDNVQSFKSKLDLLSRKKLGGAMLMSIDADDFSGRCYGEKYPLTTAIKQFFTNQKNGGKTVK